MTDLYDAAFFSNCRSPTTSSRTSNKRSAVGTAVIGKCGNCGTKVARIPSLAYTKGDTELDTGLVVRTVSKPGAGQSQMVPRQF